jgi:hypothetical protein
LDTAPYGENFQYSTGFTTSTVLQHAIAAFDTALTYGQDSLPIATLARVGKGRALLDLGKYLDAAQAVSAVSPSDTYLLSYVNSSNGKARHWSNDLPNAIAANLVNMEGQNGLIWIAPSVAQQDPRIPVTTTVVAGTPEFTSPVLQAKYVDATTTQRLADGVEAQLILAESDLKTDGTHWLSILNGLRTDGTFTITPDLIDADAVDTVWNPGTGGLSGLPPLTDPGIGTLPPGRSAADVRIDLVMHERAFWMYLTGHRQGDLRRMIRQYGRPMKSVYPVGTYVYPTTEAIYHDRVTIGVPQNEQQSNALYTGCIDRNP